MKKAVLLIAVVLILSSVPVYSEEAGLEFSVFVPESLYLHGEGTVALTSGFGTSWALADFIEIPIGFDYMKLHGMMVEGVTNGSTAVTASKPWFMSDCFIPYITVKLNLGLGPLTLSAFGGGAAFWNATLTPLRGFIAADLAPSGSVAGLSSLNYKNNFGFGWLTGAEISVEVHPVTIGLFAEYRSLSSALELSADYVSASSTAVSGSGSLSGTDSRLFIRGIAGGIKGSLSF